MCAVLEKENAALKESITKDASERDREAASLASMEKDIAAMRDRAQKAEDRSKELEAEVKELKDRLRKIPSSSIRRRKRSRTSSMRTPNALRILKTPVTAWRRCRERETSSSGELRMRSRST